MVREGYNRGEWIFSDFTISELTNFLDYTSKYFRKAFGELTAEEEIIAREEIQEEIESRN